MRKGKREEGQEQAETPPRTAADRLRDTVREAKSLASITDQELLERPELNPATRGRYDELTAQRLNEELNLLHKRKVRSARERDRVEAEQARIDQAVAAAREATDPAQSVLDMTRHQRWFGRITLTASLALSVGSAMGMEAMVQQAQGPTGVGYLAEIGLTGLSTTVIVWRGLLARAGAKVDPATLRLFAVLIMVPLLVSAVGSTIGSGPVGAACSIGSALFAGLAYFIATTSASAIAQAVAKIDRRQTAAARLSAIPEGLRSPLSPAPGVATSVGDDAAAWLAEITERNSRSGPSTECTPATPDDTVRHPLADASAAPGELQELPPIEGNRLTIWKAIEEAGAEVSNRRVAKVTGLSRDTVRNHRTALWSLGYPVFVPDQVTTDDE
ncbi:hypothetical protein [Nocardiopsis rhodophaea]|uniref:hypothetical protein n=1 Tax=Nocardiopsis rhodophaea TaxID=280238 RepID=UPI0031CE9C63